MKKKYSVTAAAVVCAAILSVGAYLHYSSSSNPQDILTPVSDTVELPEGLVKIEDNQVPMADIPADEHKYIQQIVELVNAERTKAGLAPLERSEPGMQAAAVRASELEKSFSHTRPDGSKYRTALDQFTTEYTWCGENVAYGYRSPEAVMDGWMNSEGHKANILNENFTKIGVGYHKGSNGYDYWSQMFLN